jgi:hypothetical protein
MYAWISICDPASLHESRENAVVWRGRWGLGTPLFRFEAPAGAQVEDTLNEHRPRVGDGSCKCVRCHAARMGSSNSARAMTSRPRALWTHADWPPVIYTAQRLVFQVSGSIYTIRQYTALHGCKAYVECPAFLEPYNLLISEDPGLRPIAPHNVPLPHKSDGPKY